MAKKPATIPAWATSSESKIIEPLESIKKSGWRYQDAPSSQVVNWWMNTVFQWQQYFEQSTDETKVSTRKHDAKLTNHQTEIDSLKERLVKLEQDFSNHQHKSEKPKETPPEVVRPPRLRPYPIPTPFPFPNPTRGPRPNPIFRTTNHNNEDE